MRPSAFSPLLLVLAALLSWPRPAGAQQPKAVTELHLDNGLEVLIQENHTVPLVTVWAWYRAGSSAEHPGATGLAHFVEHMSFESGEKSRQVSTVEDAGGTWNGYTWLDQTAFYETAPAASLDALLAIESGRMGSAAFPEASMEPVRNEVLAELEASLADPAEALDQEVVAAAFKTHPYRTPAVGYRADVSSFSREDALAFYKQWYVPSVATLVIVGDINARDAAKLVHARFDAIPQGAPPTDPVGAEAAQEGERRVSLEKPADGHYLEIAWRAPSLSDPDFPAFLVADAVLGGAKGTNLWEVGNLPAPRGTRLYQALTLPGLAVQARSAFLPTRASYLDAIRLAAAPGTDDTRVEAAAESAAESIARDVSPVEVERAKTRLAARLLFEAASDTDLAHQLGLFQTLDASGWRRLARLKGEVARITAEEVKRVAARYFVAEGRTVGWLLPPPPPPPPSPTPSPVPSPRKNGKTPKTRWPVPPEAFPTPSASPSASPSAAPSATPSAAATPSPSPAASESAVPSPALSTPESTPTPAASTPAAGTPAPTPAASPLPTASPSPTPRKVAHHPKTPPPFGPLPTRQVFPNGVVVLAVRNPLAPEVEVRIDVAAGAERDPVDKPGDAALCARLLPSAGRSHSESDAAALFDGAGATLDASSDPERATVRSRMLAGSLDTLLPLLREMVTRPGFPTDAFQREKAAALREAAARESDPEAVAEAALRATLYPPADPRSRSGKGSATSLAALTRLDVAEFHRRYYRPDATVISVSGDLDPAAMIRSVKTAFGDWKVLAPQSPRLALASPLDVPSNLARVPVDSGRSYAELVVGGAAIGRGDPGWAALAVVRSVLETRLAQALTIDATLARRVEVDLRGGSHPGTLLVRASVDPAGAEATLTAERQVMATLARDGVTDAEFEFARRRLLGVLARHLETNAGLAASLSEGEQAGSGAEGARLAAANLAWLSREDVNDAAKAFLPAAGPAVLAGRLKAGP